MSKLFYIDGKEYVEYSHPNGKVWSTSTALVSYPFNDSNLTEIADNKSKAYEWVRQFGIREPETVVIGSNTDIQSNTIKDLLKRHGKLIVKPDASFGSRGLSLNLTTYDQVIEAIKIARHTKQRHGNILIQQHIESSEFRFTVLRGKVVSVMLRETARIIGDGQTTITDLIKREDREREIVNQTSLVRYPAISEIIQNPEYLSSTNILAESEPLILGGSAMISGGTSVYEIVDQIHETYKQIAIDLVNGLNSGFIVVDLFIPTPNEPASENNVYFNEFNRSPAIKMFYASRNSFHIDVADLIAIAIDDYLEQNEHKHIDINQ